MYFSAEFYVPKLSRIIAIFLVRLVTLDSIADNPLHLFARYPAGFVYVYSVFYWLTGGGEAVAVAQGLFGCLYLLNLALVMAVYCSVARVSQTHTHTHTHTHTRVYFSILLSGGPIGSVGN